jgi:hypothetical protein
MMHYIFFNQVSIDTKPKSFLFFVSLLSDKQVYSVFSLSVLSNVFISLQTGFLYTSSIKRFLASLKNLKINLAVPSARLRFFFQVNNKC